MKTINKDLFTGSNVKIRFDMTCPVCKSEFSYETEDVDSMDQIVCPCCKAVLDHYPDQYEVSYDEDVNEANAVDDMVNEKDFEEIESLISDDVFYKG